MANRSFVYVMRCGNALKIGVSCNPKKRIGDLSVGNPTEITIEALLFVFGKRQAFATERRMHRKFRDSRLRGEWFDDSILESLLAALKCPITSPKGLADCTTADNYDKKYGDFILEGVYDEGYQIGLKGKSVSNPYSGIDTFKTIKWRDGRKEGVRNQQPKNR